LIANLTVTYRFAQPEEIVSSDSTNAVIATLKESRQTIASILDTTSRILLEDSVAAKIPIVSWAVAAREAVGAYRRAKLQKNVKAFLERVAEASPADMEGLIGRLRSDDSFADDFCDVTLSVLLEAARPIKAEVLGNLTLALAGGHLTKDEYSQLALILEAASVPALQALETYLDAPSKVSVERDVEPLLLGMGVARRYGTAFSISKHGRQIYELGFRKELKGPSGHNG